MTHNLHPEEITRRNQVWWSILFTLLYVVLFALGVMVLQMKNGTLPQSIALFDLVLIVLAAFRLTRLFVYDHIMEFFRDWFKDKELYTDARGAVLVHRYPPVKGPRRTINDLLGCPWCFGMWAGLLVPFFYFLTPSAWFVILAFAISGVASILMILSNLIGWSAEYKKRKTNAKYPN